MKDGYNGDISVDDIEFINCAIGKIVVLISCFTSFITYFVFISFIDLI